MNDIRLSEHFWLREFTRSEYAARMGIEIVASPEEIENLTRLCGLVLEPLRASLNAVITILSGLRPEIVNTGVGGSKTSDHRFGRASDIIVAGYTPRQVCERIVRLRLPYQQVILEFDQWTHVSIAAVGLVPLYQTLTARRVDGTVKYIPYLA